MTDKSEAEDVEPSKNKSHVVDGSDEDVAVLYLLNLPQRSSRLKFTNIFKRAIKVDIINKRTLGVAEFRTGEAAAAGLREITSRELMIGGEKLIVSTKAPPLKGTVYDYNDKTKDPAFLYILNVPTGTKQEELGKLFQGVLRVQIYGNLGIAEFKNGIAAATGLRKPSEKAVKGHKLVISIHRPKNANAIIRAVKSTSQAKPIDEDHQKPEGEEKILLAHNINQRKPSENFSPRKNETEIKSEKSPPKVTTPQVENHKESPVKNSMPLSNSDKHVKSKRNSSVHKHKDSNTKKSEKNSLEMSQNTKNSTSSDQEKSQGRENQKEEKKTSEDSSLKSNQPQPQPSQPPSKRKSRQHKSRSSLEDILVINVVAASGGGQNKRGGQPVSSQDGASEDTASGVVSKWQRTHGGNRGISEWQRTIKN